VFLNGKGFQIANLVMAAAFASSALVQYNDPDPWRWGAIYLAATGVCVWGRGPRSVWPLAVALVAGIWAMTLAPVVVAHARFADAFAPMSGDQPIVEQTREMLGLLLVADWMCVLLFRGWRRPVAEPLRE
jgi:hypothetical protein